MPRVATLAFAAFSVLASAHLGCSADTGEDVGAEDEALSAADRAVVHLFNVNTKHASEPGRPSYENTDYRQLFAYMKESGSLPDIVTLEEVGTNTDRFTSQPCSRVREELERVVKPEGSRAKWRCIVAAGATDALGNTPGGVAMLYRGRFAPSESKKLVGLYRWTPGGCQLEEAGRGWTALVQKFDDGPHTIAVAAVHLDTAGAGHDNAEDDDCSGKNLARIQDALDATHADVKVIAGDMNHGDATRHLDASGKVQHDWWETTYRTHVSALSKSRYDDAIFDDCAKRSSGTDAISRCLVADHWSMNRAGALDSRIDWVLVSGARKLEDAKTVPWADAHAAWLRFTGAASSNEKQYSDHRGQELRIRY